MSTDSASPIVALLRNRDYLRLWLAQTISYIGDYFYFLGVPIVINRLTGSTLQVGLSVIAFSLPQLFGMLAGIYVDRWDRRKTMILADLFRALIILSGFLVREVGQVWIFYVGGFILSAISIFFYPARDALIPRIVPSEQLASANGLNQVTRTAAMLAGPALAGFTMGYFGESIAWAVDSVTFLASAALIGSMAVRATGAQDARLLTSAASAVWSELREGLTHIVSSRAYVSILATMSIGMLGAGAINVLWVPFLARYHGLGAEGLGMIDTVAGAGMALGGILTGWLAGHLRFNWLVATCIFVMGLTVTLTGLAPTFGWLLGINFVFGVVETPFSAALITALQRGAPDRLRGRVLGGFNSVVGVTSLLSMAVASFLGEVVPLRDMFVVGGVVLSAAGLVAIFWLQEPAPAEDPDARSLSPASENA